MPTAVQPKTRFNTKKVRLKDLDVGRSQRCHGRFQYQKGAIKSLHRPPRQNDVYICFNTKKVRLKDSLHVEIYENPSRFQYQKGAIKSPTQFQ